MWQNKIKVEDTVACRNCRFASQDPIYGIGFKFTDEDRNEVTYFYYYRDQCMEGPPGPEPKSNLEIGYFIEHGTWDEVHARVKTWDPKLVEAVENYPRHECCRYPPNETVTVAPAWSCGEFKFRKGT